MQNSISVRPAPAGGPCAPQCPWTGRPPGGWWARRSPLPLLRHICGVEDILTQLGERDADAALAALTGLIRELKEARIDHPLSEARGLRERILAAAEAMPTEA